MPRKGSSTIMTADGPAPTPAKIVLQRHDVNRIMVIMVGAAILAAALVTPWWTRGMTVDWDEKDNPRPAGFAYEGFYVQYRPFATPGSIGGFSTDGGREAATAILGVSLVLCGIFAAAASALRIGMRLGRIETNHDLPVRFAIAATLFGLFAVMWGAFFLPLLGPNPGWLYGSEGDQTEAESFGSDEAAFYEDTRYANVGFFLGIVGGIAYPGFLWFDAARVRALNNVGSLTKPSATPISF